MRPRRAGRKFSLPSTVVLIDTLRIRLSRNMKQQGGFQGARGAESAQPIHPHGITGY